MLPSRLLRHDSHPTVSDPRFARLTCWVTSVVSAEGDECADFVVVVWVWYSGSCIRPSFVFALLFCLFFYGVWHSDIYIRASFPLCFVFILSIFHILLSFTSEVFFLVSSFLFYLSMLLLLFLVQSIMFTSLNDLRIYIFFWPKRYLIQKSSLNHKFV